MIIPVRNGGEFLHQAVTSILTQSHKNLELILVDDHSTDEAIAALDKTDSRLKIFKTKGCGVSNAFNTGLDHTVGKYVARMDADDISLPQRLECQLAYLNEHPTVRIAGCCVKIFSDTGIAGGFERYQSWLNSVRSPDEIHQQIFIESPMPNPGSMFHRSALRQLGGYRNIDWAEDYDLYLRADAAGMSMGKPDPVLLHWREHPKRITHTDPLYSRDRFMRAKAYFLVHHRLKGRPVIIWGAGPTGKLMHDLIVAEGGEIEGFLEVHPRRIGGQKRGLPVWPVEKMLENGSPMVLVAVGAAGAREKITVFMNQHAKTEGRDYLFVA